MNIKQKTEQMKKIILANKIFIALQCVFVVLSIVFNFVLDDAAVFITVFIHTGIFVVFNIIVENIVDYGYLRKKYLKICDRTHHLRYLKLKRQIYREAKSNQDKITSALILQMLIKTLVAVLNIILMLFMVSFG